MLADWVNPKYLEEKEADKIAANFNKAEPYPNFSLPNFFDKNELMKLKNEVLKEKYELADRDLFTLSHTGDLISSDNPAIKEFYDLLSSNEFIHLMEKLTGERLSQKIDMQSHSMTAGDYLLFHDDVVEGRKIAYIAYLAKDFEEKDGGRLQLFDVKNSRNPIISIIPKFCSFAGFKVSEKSVHL